MIAARSPRLTRNTLWSLIAAGVPVFALVAFVPYLLDRLGLERFGVLSLVFAILAYATALNFGLGKAVTQRVSRMDLQDDREAGLTSRIVWSATVAQSAFGMVGAAAIWLLSGPLADVLNLSDNLRVETAEAFRLLSWVVPLVLVTTTFRGLLQAKGRFGSIAAIDAPVGVLLYSLPAAAVALGAGLEGIVALLVASRIAALVAYYLVCVLSVAELSAAPIFSLSTLRDLMSFGVWVAIVDVALPLFAYVDRFVIGAVVGVARVPVYSVPQDVVNRLWLFPTSIVNALFPAASAAAALSDRAGLRRLYGSAGQLMSVSIVLGTSIVGLFANDVLAVWISPTFADEAADILRIFLIGIAINSLAMIGSTLLLSEGLSRLRASILLYEIPIYVLSLVLLLPWLGVQGAAIAWSIRMAVTFVVVQIFVARRLGFGLPLMTGWKNRALVISALAYACVLPVFIYQTNLIVKISAAVIAALMLFLAVRNSTVKELPE